MLPKSAQNESRPTPHGVPSGEQDLPSLNADIQLKHSDQARASLSDFIIKERFKDTYGGIALGDIFKAVFSDTAKVTTGQEEHRYLDVVARLPDSVNEFRACSEQDAQRLDRSKDGILLSLGVSRRFSPEAEILYRAREDSVVRACSDLDAMGAITFRWHFGNVLELTPLGHLIMKKLATTE